jgi:hypothetical protein
VDAGFPVAWAVVGLAEVLAPPREWLVAVVAVVAAVGGEPVHAARAAVNAMAPARARVLRAVMMPPAQERTTTMSNDEVHARKATVSRGVPDGKRKANSRPGLAIRPDRHPRKP